MNILFKPSHILLTLSLAALQFICTSCNRRTISNVTRLEMHLSAFGVESDDFPSIDAIIDFEHDSSLCKKSFYNPAFKPSSYRLSSVEMKHVQRLLQKADLKKLGKNYTNNRTDQPTSTTIIYQSSGKLEIKDYGLQGDYPLKELYALIYKF